MKSDLRFAHGCLHTRLADLRTSGRADQKDIPAQAAPFHFPLDLTRGIRVSVGKEHALERKGNDEQAQAVRATFAKSRSEVQFPTREMNFAAPGAIDEHRREGV